MKLIVVVVDSAVEFTCVSCVEKYVGAGRLDI